MSCRTRYFLHGKNFLSVRDKKAPRDYMAHDHSSIGSLHKTLDRLVKIVYCLLIVTRDRVNDAVLNMIF